MNRPTVTLAQLEAFIAKYESDSTDGTGKHNQTGQQRKRPEIRDLPKYLKAHKLEVKEITTGKDAETKYILKRCVFKAHEHIGTSVAVIQYPDGGIVYNCFHPDCVDKTWDDVRDLLEPDDGTADHHDTDSESAQLHALVKPLFDEPRNEIFHDAGGVGYATIPVHTWHETHPIKSKIMQYWLNRVFYRATKKNLGQHAEYLMLKGLQTRATFDSPEGEVFLRLAQLAGEPNGIWFDLCTADHKAVHIMPGKWEVVDDPPVKFLRKLGMKPLPIPIHPDDDVHPGDDGKASEVLETLLRPFINVAPSKGIDPETGELHDDAWVLLVNWLASTYWPTGPFPVGQIKGPPGSCKTSAEEYLQDLVDPNEGEQLEPPKNSHDLVISARNSWLLPFDNMQYIPEWLSDAFCRASTGGGKRVRALYTDDEETIFKYKRPILLTGISEVVTAADLLERTITFTLQKMDESQRRDKEALNADFAAKRPAILGALLSVISQALEALPHIDRVNLPRMADFSVRSQAVEKAMGWPTGTFAKAYARTQREGGGVTLETSVVYGVFTRWLDARSAKYVADVKRWRQQLAMGNSTAQEPAPPAPWKGNMTELLKALNDQRQLDSITNAKQPRGWPENARSLVNAIEKIGPQLQEEGIEIKKTDKAKRMYRITDGRPLEPAEEKNDET